MKRMKQGIVAVLCAGLMFGMSYTGYAADTPNVEELQQEISDLQEQLQTLQEENDGLKKQLEEYEAGTTEETEAVPEVPENVANADTSIEYSAKSVVLMVQQALNEKGYNCGTADGIAGSKTRESISAYEKANGLTENGIITDQLLESLGIADKVADEAKKEAEKASYSGDYSYEQIARNPDTYIGEKMKFSGKVLQAQTGSTNYIRLAMNSKYDTVIFVTYDNTVIDYRLLEDDKVTVYGICMGDYSYEAVSGATITIPWLNASIIELN